MKEDFTLSQQFEVLVPEAQKTYPIMVREWEHLKKRILLIKDNANLFHTAGTALLGVSLTTIVTALVTDFKNDGAGQVICWAAAAVTGICGGLSTYFGHKQRSDQNVRAMDVVDQMDLIEQRFQKIPRAD